MHLNSAAQAIYTVLHGFTELCTHPQITLNGYIRDEFAYIEITDNGIGMSADILCELNHLDLSQNQVINKSSLHKSYGLPNTSKRLNIYFNNKFSMKYENQLPGTKVTLTFPADFNSLE